jgi:hypothetical protein
MDVGGWLRRLGLGQYEQAFRQNEIDETVLPSLTVEDLKDLGVGAVGHRRKLLDAIAVLRAEASPAAERTDASPEADKTTKDCRASSSHSNVLGSRWVNCVCSEYGP